jgi:hypothetical protein
VAAALGKIADLDRKDERIGILGDKFILKLEVGVGCVVVWERVVWCYCDGKGGAMRVVKTTSLLECHLTLTSV